MQEEAYKFPLRSGQNLAILALFLRLGYLPAKATHNIHTHMHHGRHLMHHYAAKASALVTLLLAFIWAGPTLAKTPSDIAPINAPRSEEHTSELQSRPHLVCRL